MPLTKKIEEVFEETKQKLEALPQINTCQDRPPQREHYKRHWAQDGEIGKQLIDANQNIMFVPQEIYDKLTGQVCGTTYQREIIVYAKGDVRKLEPEDKLALGAIAEFLDGYKPPKHI